MSKKYEVYWYSANETVRRAFLCHCRDNDLWPGEGIPIGVIVEGAIGYAWAEQRVPDLCGKRVQFQPNRRCEWCDFELRCMVHPKMPAGKLTKQQLRPFNNLVAELSEPAAIAMANNLKLPIFASGVGRFLVNLECATFQRQGNQCPRRAKML